MMIFWDIPRWMLIATWLIGVNIAIVVIAHLWLWFINKLKGNNNE
tara:strand:- start:9196 stop:9330 length:135 start_codon:yes stop_codon:yes gene_type:complete